MLHLAAQIEEAVAAIRDQWNRRPRVGIILGTGIGPLAEEIETEASIDYEHDSALSALHGHGPSRPAGLRHCWPACPWWPWKAAFMPTKATACSKSRCRCA